MPLSGINIAGETTETLHDRTGTQRREPMRSFAKCVEMEENAAMRWFIASDIHGSAWYCRKMLEAYERERADRLLLLGDILYHGPRNDLPREYAPKAVIAMLNARKDEIYAVRGNCEAEVDQMVLEFPVLAEYCLLSAGKKMIYATHGHIYNEKNLPPMKEGDILMHGHTHILKAESREHYILLNPGSVSLPKEGNVPSYAILEDEYFEIKDLEGTSITVLKLEGED